MDNFLTKIDEDMRRRFDGELDKACSIGSKIERLSSEAKSLREEIKKAKHEGYLRSQILLTGYRPKSKMPDKFRPRSQNSEHAEIRKSILDVLCERGTFHINDIGTPYHVAKPIIRSLIDRNIIVRSGQRQTEKKRRANVYKLVNREDAECLRKSVELEIFVETGLKNNWLKQDEAKLLYGRWFEKPTFKKEAA